MKLKRTETFAAKLVRSSRAGFTLVELLAALAVMAMVIPVAVHALAIANRAGQFAQRKAIAARVADRMLSEYVAGAQSTAGRQKGTVQEGVFQFDWDIRTETWREDNMRMVTCEVSYPLQGQKYYLQTSTLIGIAQ